MKTISNLFAIFCTLLGAGGMMYVLSMAMIYNVDMDAQAHALVWVGTFICSAMLSYVGINNINK